MPPRMIRIALIVVLVLVVGGLAFLGLSPPTYHPQHIEQPVALPSAAGNAPAPASATTSR